MKSEKKFSIEKIKIENEILEEKIIKLKRENFKLKIEVINMKFKKSNLL
ncbi:hypothetical protein [Flavobacterium sp.]